MKSNTALLTIYTQFTSLLREKYGKVTGKERTIGFVLTPKERKWNRYFLLFFNLLNLLTALLLLSFSFLTFISWYLRYLPSVYEWQINLS